MSYRYAAEVFAAPTMEDARRIILTDEEGQTSDQRWERETPWIQQRIREHLWPELTLDYGCGVGRLANGLGYGVIGVDESPLMRAHAMRAMDGERFCALSPEMMVSMVAQGLRVRSAYCVWVLQHARDPGHDVALLRRAIEPGGRLLLINRERRCVPVTDGHNSGWADDGVNIDDLLSQGFTQKLREPMPPDLCAPGAFLSVWYHR